MGVLGLRLTMEPKDPIWQLPNRALSGASTGLIGWICAGSAADAGVPLQVQRLLTSSLCAHWQLAFPVGGAAFQLAATTEPETAMSLFEQPGYSWGLQAQIVFLYPPAGGQFVTEESAKSVLRDRENALARLRGSAVEGVMLPAVDGDFAAISLLTDSWTPLVNKFEKECSRAGISWDIISETQFRRSDWYSGPAVPGREARTR